MRKNNRKLKLTNIGLLILGFILIFLIVTQLILFIISRVGGWHELSQKYPANKLFVQEKTWYSCKIKLNKAVNYMNIVTVSANSEGMRLSMPILFRIGHSPIFLPWSEMEISEEDFRHRKWTCITMKKCNSTVIKFPKDFFEEIKRNIRLTAETKL